MITANVLHVLRRFIATIGCPKWIICDNAQIFKTINQCYSSLPVPNIDEDIIDYCITNRIQMKPIVFIRPHARLCGLYPTENLDQWLPFQTTRDTLLADWNRTSTLVSDFWTRWGKEYLTTMREQYTTELPVPRSHEEHPPKCGDIVPIHDTTLDRRQREIGRIIASQDNYQRSAQIQLPSKQKCGLLTDTLSQHSYYVRLPRLYKNLIPKHLFCPAQPICETMRCILCWERFYNTQCWTYTQTILVVIILLIFSYGSIRLSKLWLICCDLSNKLPSLFNKRRPIRTYIDPRKRRRKHNISTCLALLCLQIPYGYGCSQTTSITANENICFKNRDKETCTFNEATMITLKPLQQESCLILNNYNNQPIGLLTIKVDGIDFECQRDVQFYARDHQILSELSRRKYLFAEILSSDHSRQRVIVGLTR
ncbi:unnamed protein product [Strongylus vulgaris]|uniref:DUF5641 domain-containing protein n=1 Tax=Strongylus vulgaris TaxID=40348 RepID=A0A3P7J2Q1_STRVU|nr:unnamed protein product [Strongylus vulgaris]